MHWRSLRYRSEKHYNGDAMHWVGALGAIDFLIATVQLLHQGKT